MAESWVIALITTGGGVLTSLCAYFVKKRRNRTMNNKISRKILKNHYIFSQIEYWQNEMIPQTKFGDEGRNAIIHDFLEIILTNTINILKDFIENKLNNNTQEEFHSCVIRILFQIKNESESIAIANGIPEKFIEKFNNWNSRTTIFTKGCIDNICRSRYYPTNKNRIYAILNILMSAYESTILDGENTLCSLNGELDGVVYKNIVLDRGDNNNDRIDWGVLLRYTKDGIITNLTHFGEQRLNITPVEIVGSTIFDYIDEQDSLIELNKIHKSFFNQDDTDNDIKLSIKIKNKKSKIHVQVILDEEQNNICLLSPIT
jgi:hypothetical protein